MFVLRGCNDSLHYLLPEKVYTVGRKECDILIIDDQSISRKHAKLTVMKNKVILCDCESRYNTFIDDVKSEGSIPVLLTHGCVIRFGMLHSIYRFEEIKLVITSSGINLEQKKKLSGNIQFLGGTVTQNWCTECTHLTVEEIMLTVKVLCAVIDGKPIVKLNFWEDYVQNVKNHLPPPNTKDYVPRCMEAILSKNISLEYNERRRSLFKNKVFVFASENEKSMLEDMIILAGGKTISWEKHPITIEEYKKSTAEYIFMQNSESLCRTAVFDSFDKMINHVHKTGKRSIPVQEIAFSVVDCSCEKDCNPDFDRKGVLLSKPERIQPTQKILAPETQSQNVNLGQNLRSEIIPESFENDVATYLTCKKVTTKEIDTSTQFDVDNVKIGKRNADSLSDLDISEIKKIKTDEKEIRVSSSLFQLGSTSTPKSTLEKSRKNNLFEFRKPLESVTETHETASTSAIVSDENMFTKKRKANFANGNTSPSKKVVYLTGDLAQIKAVPSTSKSTTSENSISNKFKTFSETTSKTITDFTDTKPAVNKSGLSRLSVDTANEKCITWLSKFSSGDINDSMNVPRKNDVDVDLEDENSKFIISFKNTIVIETNPTLIKKSLVCNNSSLAISINNLKNFKKFQKTEPRSYQTRIFPRANFVTVVCNEHNPVVLTSDSDEDSDHKNISNKPANKSVTIQKTKRFQF